MACEPSEIPELERETHRELLLELFGSAWLERRWAGNGWAVRFAKADLARLERFVVNERRCCSFLHFSVDPSQDEVWLRMSGPAGASEILEAYFTRVETNDVEDANCG